MERARSKRFEADLASHDDDEYTNRDGERVRVEGLDSLAAQTAEVASSVEAETIEHGGESREWRLGSRKLSIGATAPHHFADRGGSLKPREAVEFYRRWGRFAGLDVFALSFEAVAEAEESLGRSLTDAEGVDVITKARELAEWWEEHGAGFLAEVVGCDPEDLDEIERRATCGLGYEADITEKTALDYHRRAVYAEAHPLHAERRSRSSRFAEAWKSAERHRIEEAGKEYVRASDALVAALDESFANGTPTPGLSHEEAVRRFGFCGVCRPDRTCAAEGCDAVFRPQHAATKNCPEHARTKKPTDLEGWVDHILEGASVVWVEGDVADEWPDWE